MTVRQRMFGGAALVLVAIAAVLVVLLSVAGSEEKGDRYRVHINFSETVSDAELAEAAALLQEYDPDSDLAILESFPLQGSAIVRTDEPGFCDLIVGSLEARSYVRSASCDVYSPAGDGDEPVSSSSEE